MIRKCPIIINNDAVTVVRFGDTEVQFPAIHRNATGVNVRFDSGKYTVVADDYNETPAVKPIKEDMNGAKIERPAHMQSKRWQKKTTIEKVNEDNEPDVAEE